MNIWYLTEENDGEKIPENTTHIILSKTYNRKFSLLQIPKTVVFLDLGWEYNYFINFSIMFPNLETLIVSLFYGHEIDVSKLPISLHTIILGRCQKELVWKSIMYKTTNDWIWRTKINPCVKKIVVNKTYQEKMEQWRPKIKNVGSEEDYQLQYLAMDEYWMKKNLIYTLVPSNQIPNLLIEITNIICTKM